MKKLHLLLIDDQEDILHCLNEIFEKKKNIKISFTSSFKKATELLSENIINIILINNNLFKRKEYFLIPSWKHDFPKVKFIIISQLKENKKNVAEIIKYQSDDFLFEAGKKENLKNLLDFFLFQFQVNDYPFNNIIAKTKKMYKVLTKIYSLKNCDAPIMILGESGTGKELIAKTIHTLSSHAGGAFVAINCGAIPKDLLESELFGHKKGAFTGAIHEKIGSFQLAHNGTLFLDEIGDLSLDLQVKLLRVLQEKEISPIGSNDKIKINVKIISATHQNLNKKIKEKKFREDLYFRIGVIPIYLPPLRKRKKDIPLLAKFFLEKMNKKYKKSKFILEPAMQQLINYNWKGNIRELENLIQRIFFMNTRSVIARIPSHIFEFDKKLLDLTKEKKFPSLAKFEKKIIKKALKVFKNNILKTSKALKISRDTLYRKIKIYNIKTSNK